MHEVDNGPEFVIEPNPVAHLQDLLKINALEESTEMGIDIFKQVKAQLMEIYESV